METINNKTCNINRLLLPFQIQILTYLITNIFKLNIKYVVGNAFH